MVPRLGGQGRSPDPGRHRAGAGFTRPPPKGYRTALGILRLGKTHGKACLEAACLRAIPIKTDTHRRIAAILKHALKHQTPIQVQANLPPARPCARLPVLPLIGPILFNHPTYERLIQRRLIGMTKAMANAACWRIWPSPLPMGATSSSWPPWPRSIS